MNAIAAHKDQLEGIARELVGQYCRLKVRFRGVAGCLYHAPRYKLLRHQLPASVRRQRK